MKIIFIRSIGLVLVSMITVLGSFAQKTDSKNEFASQFSYNPVNKTRSSSTESVPINEKILKHFNKISHNVSDVQWIMLNDKYLAEFTKESTSNSILFDKKGNIIYSITYSSEKQLPSEIKNLIEDGYEDYNITSVAKVIQNKRTIWIVNLAGNCHFITARIEDGEMEEMRKFNRGN